MKVSLVLTVYNEESSIGALLRSLFIQSKRPDEIVIVDALSSDKTVAIIKHFQKKNKKIKLLVQKCTRSEGRNLGVELAKNDIIAMTDAGCIAKGNWLENLTSPFRNKEVDISAGFYKMVCRSSFQKAASVFLGVMPKDFNINFLPSTRSMAFRRESWEKLGGFPENLKSAAEDSVFNFRAVKSGMKIARVKNAVVGWGMPAGFSELIKKIAGYAEGDARSKIFWSPAQGFSSHNIKVLFIFLRYLAAVYLIFISLQKPTILVVLLVLVVLYLIRAFRKVYLEYRDTKAGLWGIVLQISSDLCVMVGFLRGIIN